jgi:hypothetical protein
MFARMSTGWQLATQSFEVLKTDKQLLIFPLFSGIACLLVLASFAVPLWHTPQAQALMHERVVPGNTVSYLVLFAFYLVNYFVVVFFNSALVACAVIRFKGGSPTIGDGFRVAIARLPQIAGWAMVSATVGFALRVIESRSEKVAALVAGILGMAWSVVTYLAIPVLVIEQATPLEIIKRSTALIRRTWGEALGAHFGTSMIFVVVFLVALLPLMAAFGLGVFLMGAGFVVLGSLAFAVGVAMVVLVGLISATLDAIILAAVYIYAAEGVVPEAFGKDTLAGMFAKG